VAAPRPPPRPTLSCLPLQVYDVSHFTPRHPGGAVILTYAGKDATDVFAAFHAGATWGLLKQFFVGDLVEADAAPAPGSLLADYRALRVQLRAAGLFKADGAYYAWKAASTLALAATSLALLAAASASATPLYPAIASALVMGLFWQQSGWLAHDFCHQQVFSRRAANDAVALFLGNVCQGFSVAWWKAKHNQHHAAPNELDAETKLALDPDIDTLPLIAWSRDMLATAAGAPRAIMRHQHRYFVAVLLFARLAWAQGSAAHALALLPTKKGARAAPGSARAAANPKTSALAEVSTLALHYAWTLGAAVAALGPLGGLAHILASQLFCGLLLSLVFVQSHNAMEVYSEVKDFMTAQAVSTRDGAPSRWRDWVTCGLNYQLEHHAFPNMPRHHLGAAAGPVRALCEKHGLPYEVVSMPVGTSRVLAHLADVAALA